MSLKFVLRLMLVIGVSAAAWLTASSGFKSIVALLTNTGWRLLLLLPLHIVPLYLDVLGWNLLIMPRNRVRTLFFIASIREAINRLLPVANIGGEIVGIGLLSRRGTPLVTAAASVVVETLLTLVSQYLFVMMGALGLVLLTGSGPLTRGLVIGLAVGFPLLALMFIGLHRGAVFQRVGRMAKRLSGAASSGKNPLALGESLDAEIRAVLARYTALLGAVIWQLAGLLAGCIETWLVLGWLGHPVALSTALVLESLTQAVKHLVFVVPAGIGVQEAGLILLGRLLGFGPDVAIALSLAKRLRELLFGMPCLAAWQLAGRAPPDRLLKTGS